MRAISLILLVTFFNLANASTDSCQKLIQSFLTVQDVRPVKQKLTRNWISLEENNKALTLTGDTEINDYLFDIIQHAEDSIEIQSLKMHDPKWVDLLIKKANEGVKVHIQISDISRLNTSQDRKEEAFRLLRLLKKSNITIDQFDTDAIDRKTTVFRPDMHKKVVIVDNRFAYIGNKNFNSHSDTVEFGVGLQGTKAQELRSLFYKDLANSTKNINYIDEVVKIAQQSQVKFYNSYELKQNLIKSIQQSEKTITLSQVEFSDADIVNALISKKKLNPNIEIQIITVKNIREYRAMGITLNRPFNVKSIETLRQNGILVHFIDFEKTEGKFFHGKLTVFDDKKIILGSSDYNKRSFKGNLELDLEISSELMAKEFKDYLKAVINNVPTEYHFTFSEKLLSQLHELLFDLLMKINEFKIRTIDKVEISHEFFSVLLRRKIGEFTQAIATLKGVYNNKFVTELDDYLRPYQHRIVTNEILSKSSVSNDDIYVFVGSSTYAAKKNIKLGIEPTKNGYYGDGYYFATNIETALDYSALRNRQLYDEVKPSEVLIYKVKKEKFNSYLNISENSKDSHGLLIEAAEGENRDYLILNNPDQFELVQHLMMK